MKTIKRMITFKQLAKFFNGLPPSLVGELVTALMETWGERYGDEEFEPDYEIIGEHIQEISAYIADGLTYDEVIKKLIKRDKDFSKTWIRINDSVIKHIPIDERDNIFTLMVGNSKMLLPTNEPITFITRKKTTKLQEDKTKNIWKGNITEAASKVREIYEEDLKQPIRNYKNMKDATYEYFENTNFIKYRPGQLSKEKFYELVKKSK